MSMILLLLVLLIQTQEYDFPALYKADMREITHGHGKHDRDGKLSEFARFAKIDAKGDFASFGSVYLNGVVTRQWENGKGKVKSMRRVERCVPTPNGLCLKFIGYKFTEAKKTYHYVWVEGQGLMAYQIADKRYSITHESIVVGLDQVYLDALNEMMLSLDQKL